jgi:hypothetical protein
MRTTILKMVVACVLFVSTTYSQQLVNHSVEQLSTNYVSPNIVADDFAVNLVSDGDIYTIQSNFPINSQYEPFRLGAGYTYTDTYKGFNAFIGCNTGKFKMSIIAGFYETPTRKATYGGPSFSYHHKNGYIGITVADLFDVAMDDGDDTDFYNYEAMTPQVFAKQEVLHGGDFGVNLHGNVSYHDIDNLNYRSTVEATYLNHSFGVGYSKRNQFMTYATVNIGCFHLLGSYDGDFFFGLRYQ